jgi:hypothetical protein
MTEDGGDGDKGDGRGLDEPELDEGRLLDSGADPYRDVGRRRTEVGEAGVGRGSRGNREEEAT